MFFLRNRRYAIVELTIRVTDICQFYYQAQQITRKKWTTSYEHKFMVAIPSSEFESGNLRILDTRSVHSADDPLVKKFLK